MQPQLVRVGQIDTITIPRSKGRSKVPLIRSSKQLDTKQIECREISTMNPSKMRKYGWNSKSESTDIEIEYKQPEQFAYIIAIVNNGKDLEPSDVADLLEKYTKPLDESISHLEPLRKRLLLDLLNIDLKFEKYVPNIDDWKIMQNKFNENTSSISKYTMEDMMDSNDIKSISAALGEYINMDGNNAKGIKEARSKLWNTVHEISVRTKQMPGYKDICSERLYDHILKEYDTILPLLIYFLDDVLKSNGNIDVEMDELKNWTLSDVLKYSDKMAQAIDDNGVPQAVIQSATWFVECVTLILETPKPLNQYSRTFLENTMKLKKQWINDYHEKNYQMFDSELNAKLNLKAGQRKLVDGTTIASYFISEEEVNELDDFNNALKKGSPVRLKLFMNICKFMCVDYCHKSNVLVYPEAALKEFIYENCKFGVFNEST